MPDQVTYSLLVSNVGWVRSPNDHASYDEVKALYDDYAESKRYEQVTMWASDDPDPVAETYTEGGL